MSVSYLTVVFPSTFVFGAFCAKVTPWVEKAEADENGVVQAEVLMLGDSDITRMQVYNCDGTVVDFVPGLDYTDDVEVLVCPHCGGLNYYPFSERIVNCGDCLEDFVVSAIFEEDPEKDSSPVILTGAARVAINALLDSGGVDPDYTHCDDCGDLIDSATAGCQSAGEGQGCKGWEYNRDVLGIDIPRGKS